MRSICNKFLEWYHFLYTSAYDVVLLTETWLHGNIPNGMLDPECKYNIFRCDRQTTGSEGERGGGVCILVAKPIHCVSVDTHTKYPTLELCCVDLVDKSQKCRLFAVYSRPVNGKLKVDYMSELIKCFHDFDKVSWPVVITGDFNCPDINWSSLVVSCDRSQDDFLNYCITGGFTQLVESPTRGSNILDLILTNEPLFICDVTVEEPFVTGDHNRVVFNLYTNDDCDQCQRKIPNKVYDWDKADFRKIEQCLANVDWYSVVQTKLTVDELWETFCEVLYSIVDLHVPTKHLVSYQKNTHKKHYPYSIRRANARKRLMWRQCRNDPMDVAKRAAYKQSVQKYRLLLRKYEIKKEKELIESNNIGNFYKFVNKKLSCKEGIGALVDGTGKILVTDSDRADALNGYFATVGTVDDGATPYMAPRVKPGTTLSSVDFTDVKIRAAIKKLKSNKASGVDGLPPILFKKVMNALVFPLSLLFQSFFSIGMIPTQWKYAVVTPVYKGGSSSDVKNYRPISLNCVASKLMERVIVVDVLYYLRSHKLISPQQHGFLARRSTVSNLLESINDWTVAINNKNSVMIAYIDYAKAFDSVSHKKLTIKLQAYGIAGDLLNWINYYLSDRYQCTRIGQCCSKFTKIVSGVVQGSVIGPLLFTLYINDVTDIFADDDVSNQQTTSQLYADDLKLYTVIKKSDDVEEFRWCLTRLVEWSHVWQLSISSKKCNVMCCGSVMEGSSVLIDGSAVSVTKCVRDLGVLVDCDLKFTEHISSVTSRGHSRANLILKCFASRDHGTLLRSFTTYVRPLLEYASPVWSPSTKGAISKIESVQRRFTKRMPGLSSYSYEARLALLKLESLETRRIKADLVYVYKIVFHLVDIDPDNFFSVTGNNSTTRGHAYKLYINYCRLNTRKYFFCNRVANVWNALEASPADFKTLQTFKQFLKTTDILTYF